ncbi:MAG: VCBS repeat-containing protein [Desulfobulbaceae bacterium]|nr:VCBS repeat-containing protein [Desulfobulbaceae bacterium]
MKTYCYPYRVVFWLILSCIFLFSSMTPALGQSRSVAFLPFDVHADRDLSYLSSGIRDMLASRLAGSVGIKIIDKGMVDSALAGSGKISRSEEFVELGRRLQSDYVVAGSLTALGGGVSLDAKVYFVSGSAMTENFYATAAKEDDVIVAIDDLAWDIAEKVFSYKRPASRLRQAAIPAGPAASPYTTAHPERAFMYPPEGGYGSSPFVRPRGIAGALGFTKTQNLKMFLQAMDVGDVDGDGIDDVVMAGGTEIFFYHRTGNRLEKFGSIPVLARYTIHGISLADLNNNGRNEVYVSCADDFSPNSFAIEWQDKGFEYLFKDARWFVKPITVPGEGEILAGQRAGGRGGLMPGIFGLTVNNGNLDQGSRLPVPKAVNLFNFSMVDLDGDGQTEIVAIDDADRLRVYQPGGKLLWKSDDYYGGTKSYIGDHSIRKSRRMDEDAERIYVPSRIVVQDINRDGIQDVILNKNLSTSSRLFKRLKSYPSGEIHGLIWNGIGLAELWRTRKIDGYVADYQLRLRDVSEGEKSSSDGPDAILYVGVVLRSGWMDAITSEESTMIMYQLDFESEKEGM